MSQPVSSPIPLYYQVYTVLRQRVIDGTYEPGSQLAPADELAGEFDVSLATIRQAVGELVKENLVSRHQGRGTFVLDRPHGAFGHVFRGNLRELVAAGAARKTKVTAISVRHGRELPGRVAGQLQLPDGRGTIVQRTRLLDDVAFAYTVDYLPDELGRKLTRAKLTQQGVLQQLENAGVVLEGARQTVRAQLADLAVSEALGVPLGSAVLYVERLMWSPDEQPIEFFQSWYRGDRYEYTVTYARNGGEDLRSRLA